MFEESNTIQGAVWEEWRKRLKKSLERQSKFFSVGSHCFLFVGTGLCDVNMADMRRPLG